MLDIGSIEQALADMLVPLGNSLGVRTIKPYQNDFDAPDQVAELFPGLFVAFIRSRFEISGNRIEERLVFDVLAGNSSYGDVMSARHDTTGGPGVYTMMHSAKELLLGKSPGPGLGRISPVECVPVYNSDGISVFALRIELPQFG